jgi:hypothetical protein
MRMCPRDKDTKKPENGSLPITRIAGSNHPATPLQQH